MEEEIEESIVKKKIPAKITGKNFFLYIFLIFNTLMAIYILSVQLNHRPKSKPTSQKFQDSKQVKRLEKSHFVKFDIIVTNLSEYDGPRRYIRVRPVVEVKEGKQYEEISLKKNVIRNQIIAYLNTLNPGHVLEESGMKNIKSEIKKIFKKVLTHTQIDMLYFSEFRVN